MIPTYDLMQLNKTKLLDQPVADKTVYLETDFDHYPMFANQSVNYNLYKTQDGRRSKDNLRARDKSKLLKMRQRSTKDLNSTLKRSQSKRFTSRGTK